MEGGSPPPYISFEVPVLVLVCDGYPVVTTFDASVWWLPHDFLGWVFLYLFIIPYILKVKKSAESTFQFPKICGKSA